MESKAKVVKLLNGLLTTELRAINQYFLDSKMASHWGLDGLAAEYREASFEEMRDAEKLMDRILMLGGLPNLQRADPFAAGETVVEQLRLAAQLEEKAVSQLHAAISGAEAAADPATSLMLREMLLGEEAQLDWIDAQLGLIERVGEANYLSQKMNK